MSPWLCSGMETARAAGQTGSHLASAASWMSNAAIGVPVVVDAASCPSPILTEGAVQSVGDGPVPLADGMSLGPTDGGVACRNTTAPSPCPQGPR